MRKWVIAAIGLSWAGLAHGVELEATVKRLENAGGAELFLKGCEPYLPQLLKFQECEFLQSRPAPPRKKVRGQSPGEELLAALDRPPAQYSIKIYLDDTRDVRWLRYREFDAQSRRSSIMKEMGAIMAVGPDNRPDDDRSAKMNEYISAILDRKVLPPTMKWIEVEAGTSFGGYEFILKRK